MKKIICLITVVAVISAGLCGCGRMSDADPTDNTRDGIIGDGVDGDDFMADFDNDLTRGGSGNGMNGTGTTGGSAMNGKTGNGVGGTFAVSPIKGNSAVGGRIAHGTPAQGTGTNNGSTAGKTVR